MKKKITALLLAAVVVFGFAACGGEQVNEDVKLYDYEAPEYAQNDMPLSIETEEDVRDAFRYIINNAVGDGATFNGISVTDMSQQYFIDETAKNGYETEEFYGSFKADGDYYFMQAGNMVDRYDYSKRLDSIYVNFKDEELPAEAVEKFNSEICIGRADEVIGKSIAEAIVTLGIDDDLLNWIMQFETKNKDNTYYGYSWYEGPEVFYRVQLTKTDNNAWGKTDYQLTFKREKNGHSEEIEYNTLMSRYCNNITFVRYTEKFYFEDYDSYEDYLEIQKLSERRWFLKREMSGGWVATEKIENGTAVPLAPDEAYLEIDLLGNAIVHLPGLTDDFADASCKTVGAANIKTTENGEVYYMPLTVSEAGKQYFIMESEYSYEQDMFVLYKEDGSLKFVFERLF
ncbi:MAG: hypothetical protein E7484_04250 [Ruminococcaceae bacterium]|nr:hypothetical protein [Oscillospiraceae bacterium]